MTGRRGGWIMAAAAVWMLAGCGDSDGDGLRPVPEENNGTTAGAATFVTWNVGLPRGFVPYASDRVGPVTEALAGLEADVVCLQEVWLVEDDAGAWTESDLDAVRAATAERFPHVLVHVTREEEGEATPPSCTEEEVAPLQMCAEESCAGVSDDNLSSCVLGNCQDEFFATSPGCQSCAASQLGNPLEEIIATCTTGGGAKLSYGGHNGLMLLSRHPLTAMDTLDFESVLTQRSALRATVAVPDAASFDVVCTHLAADLSASIAYPGGTYASFAEENAAQIDGLLEWADAKATTGRSVILGDFNVGPTKGESEAELGSNYPRFGAAGYADPYVDGAAAPLCTFCPSENTLDNGEGARLLDHVFLKLETPASSVMTRRLLDQVQPIETGEGTLDLHLSDHFAVEATVAP